MITRVLLRNWRGYEKLSLDLGPGLSFVVADNGVGKTSLVNAVAWAVFGDASGVDGAAAIRAGSGETTVEVDLAVGDTAFSVRRARRRQGRGREIVEAAIDGRAASPAELRTRLAEAAKVPSDIGCQLMFVPEMRLTHEAELFADVQDHLGGLLGIDHLRRAADTARQVQVAAGRQLRALREEVRSDEEVVAAARAAMEAAEAELGRLDTELLECLEERDRLEEASRLADDWTAYDVESALYRRALEALTEDAGAIGIDLGDDGDVDALVEAEEDVVHQSQQVQAELASAEAEAALVRGLVDQLESATDARCPVCLRPIDEDVAHHASEAHRTRLAEIDRRQAETERRRAEVTDAATKLRDIARGLAQLRPPRPPAQPRPDQSADEIAVQRTTLEDEITEVIARKGALGEQLRRAEEAVDAADRARAATADLARLQALSATASSLALLADSEADARTERCLDPLSRTLARHWAEFFVSSSSRPRLAGGGTIELGVAGTTIPYSSFSGGEKTLASLLTRLLFVTSATAVDSMWLDEPLEHLDPANRTKVTRLLSQVCRPGRHMRQVLVTTYEEGLARSLAERDESASVLYISTDDLI